MSCMGDDKSENELDIECDWILCNMPFESRVGLEDRRTAVDIVQR